MHLLLYDLFFLKREYNKMYKNNVRKTENKYRIYVCIYFIAELLCSENLYFFENYSFDSIFDISFKINVVF